MPKGIKGSYKRYDCKVCGKTVKWGDSKLNIYCSNVCQRKEARQALLESWLAGTYSNNYGKFPGVGIEYMFEKQGNKCGICGIKDWNGKPIKFQSDHIDGNSDNNGPDNLQVICPNCHTQTDTWGKKGRTPKTDQRNVKRRSKYKLTSKEKEYTV
jgi:endogenous inhibitor of DNA gyrase (YacG/DUF329 family)